MTEVRFYHLTRSSLEATLPIMLERTLGRDQNAVVQAASEARVESLTTHLWTYNEAAFLPHGSARDGNAALQPIWLTDKNEAAPNGAEVLFLTDGASNDDIAGYALCAILFDGNDSEAVVAARRQWSDLKSAGHAVTYWQQDESGRWEQKA